MALFAGTFENKVDVKGRVSIPAPFRAEIDGFSAGAFYLYPALTHQALAGCTLEWMEDIKSGLKALPAFSKKRHALTTAVFGRARLVKLDDAGRIVLPRDFAAFAGIEGQATFVGMAETFEIWQPALAATAQDAAVAALLEDGFESLLSGENE